MKRKVISVALFFLLAIAAAAADAVEPECLPQDKPLAFHIHAQFYFVFILHKPDSYESAILGTPRIGLSETCAKEIHVHQEDGVIHIESADAAKTFTLGDFLDLLGKEKSVPELSAAHLVINGVPASLAEARARILENNMVIFVFLNIRLAPPST